jgi:hypothetical protein
MTEKLLVRVVCPKANQVIGEVRSDQDAGPLLWYRMNVLHASLMQGEEAPEVIVDEETLKLGDTLNLTTTVEVDRIESRDGKRIVHFVQISGGSKRQRGGRVDWANEHPSCIALNDADAIVEWGMGCPACNDHVPDLAELLSLARTASKSSGPLKYVL